MISQANERLAYEAAKDFLRGKVKPDIWDGIIMSQGFLRTELQASVTQTNMQFGVLVNQYPQGGNGFNTEQRLNINDAFVVNAIGVFVAKPTSATDTTFELCTYPSPIIFATANVVKGLNTLYYNSKLTLNLDGNKILTAWDLSRHLVVPETQLTGATNTPVDMKSLDNDGFYPVQPLCLISGTSNIDLQIQMPAAFAAVETNQRTIIKLYGFLAQNSTVVRSV